MLSSDHADHGHQHQSRFRVKVMLATALPFEGGVLDYLMAGEDRPDGNTPEIGQIVIGPLGQRSVPGVIVGLSDDDLHDKRLKPLEGYSDLPPLSPKMLDLLRWVAAWTMAPVGAVLKMALPVKDALLPPKGQKAWQPAQITDLNSLSDKRRAVIEALQEAPPMTSTDAALLAGVSKAMIAAMAKDGLLEQVTIPPEDQTTIVGGKAKDSIPSVTLTPAQQQAADEVKIALDDGQFAPFAGLGLT